MRIFTLTVDHDSMNFSWDRENVRLISHDDRFVIPTILLEVCARMFARIVDYVGGENVGMTIETFMTLVGKYSNEVDEIEVSPLSYRSHRSSPN